MIISDTFSSRTQLEWKGSPKMPRSGILFMTHPSNNHPSLELLQAYSQGSLGNQDTATIQQHLQICPSCQKEQKELLARMQAAQFPQGVSPDLTAIPAPSVQGMLERGNNRAPVQSMPAPPKMPASIPGYQLLGELGRGTTGVVYKAQHLGLNRIVALKVILSSSHAEPEERANLKKEALAIAGLQHPGIVQIFDCQEHGEHLYFSLEYVDGGSLAQRLRQTNLNPAQAVNLVEKLAATIHFAHQHNIVHRDLKPANVLVTKSWDLKITDFGLAKRLDETGETQTGIVKGTPSYMAPEQARGAVREIGPAADVYALGAILYECLTRRPPFNANTVTDTLFQVIREEPIAPRALDPGIPKDLETICLKCLHKDPRARYASAEELAKDFARFRAGEPIHARPVGRMEKLAMWAQRNPGLSTLALALLFVLLIGFTLTTVAWRRAASQKREAILLRDQAEAQKLRAEKEKARAELALGKAQKEEQRARGAEEQAKQHLQTAFEALKELASAQFDQASLLASLGNGAEAVETYDQVLNSLRNLYREQPDNNSIEKMLGSTLGNLANLEKGLGHSDRAVRLAEECQQISLRRSRKDPSDVGRIVTSATSYMNLGSIYASQRDDAKALSCYREGEKLLKALLQKQTNHVEALSLLAGITHNIGNLLDRSASPAECIAEYRKAIRLQTQVLVYRPKDPDAIASLALYRVNLAISLSYDKQREEAEKLYGEALDALNKLVEDHPNVAFAKKRRGETYHNYAQFWIRGEDFPKAHEQIMVALDIREKLMRRYPTNSEYVADFANSLVSLGRIMGARGKPEEGEKFVNQALGLLDALVRDHPDSREFEILRKRAMRELDRIKDMKRV